MTKIARLYTYRGLRKLSVLGKLPHIAKLPLQVLADYKTLTCNAQISLNFCKNVLKKSNIMQKQDKKL